jgi:DNA-binding Xre family transcriptional regulator
MESDRRAEVAAEIRAELARQRVPQTALISATGISKNTLRRRLNGVKPFYVHELEAICSFLNIPLSEFLDRTRSAA